MLGSSSYTDFASYQIHYMKLFYKESWFPSKRHSYLKLQFLNMALNLVACFYWSVAQFK